MPTDCLLRQYMLGKIACRQGLHANLLLDAVDDARVVYDRSGIVAWTVAILHFYFNPKPSIFCFHYILLPYR